MTDLFREVEEDLRREQFSKLWSKYGIYVIGAAVAIVLVVAAVVGWRAWSHSQRVAASARFDEVVKASADATPAEAAAAFAELAGDTSGGYRTLALLHEADKRLAAGERDAALEVYDRIGNDGGVPSIIRGMAAIKAGLLRVDTASYDDMKARMAPLLAEGDPWRENALELLALAAMREGKWQDVDANARQIIANPATPAGLRDRAHVLQALAAPHLPRAEVAPEETQPEAQSDDVQPETQPETDDAPAPGASAETE
ncbi:MAG: tetratricopeptide repeat protein [Parvibaculum sp.]